VPWRCSHRARLRDLIRSAAGRTTRRAKAATDKNSIGTNTAGASSELLPSHWMPIEPVKAEIASPTRTIAM
jgi:hypothetical protein